MPARSSKPYIDDSLIAAAATRVEAALSSKLSWSTWRADAANERQKALANTDRVMLDARLLAMTRQALCNDGHCKEDAPNAAIAAFTFEQLYLNAMTTAVQERGDFWGGRKTVAADVCRLERAATLVTEQHVASLIADGLVVIDGALSQSEVRAARREMADLDTRGQLSEVECQSRARVRGDRIGWLSEASAASFPALGVAMRLLRALPAEVERHAAAVLRRDPECARYWRCRIPSTCMVAIYPGSRTHPTFYCKHFDGGTASNPRRLTAIVYLNAADWASERDGGALRAYYPPSSSAHGSYIDVEPRGGRILLFDSCTVEHEVRPTYADRMALTMWASKSE